MPTDVIMPQMGESIFEGTITKWLKKPGDKVQRDEPLFEISTDKVDAEIPAPASGVLQEIMVTEGNTVQVNTIVGTIAADGESAAPAKSAAKTPAAPAPQQKESARAAPASISARRPQPRHPSRTTKTSAPRPWSARSRARIMSISHRSPAPDWAGASPSKTSWPSSRKAQPPRQRLLSKPLRLSHRPQPRARLLPRLPPRSRAMWFR